MSVSPQEKDKLRKRLQKLFQNEGHLKGPATGALYQQTTNTATNRNENSKPKKGDLDNYRNKKNQQPVKQKRLKVTPIQNGFGKATSTKSSENKLTKSKEFSLEKDVPKLQRKNKATTIKANGKVSSKKQFQNKTQPSSKQNNIEKPIKADKVPKKPTKSKDFESKSQGKHKNTIKSHQKENNMEKQIKANKVPKKSPINKDFGSKSQAKLGNKKIENTPKQKDAKPKLDIQQNKSVANNFTNFAQSQSKKSKKRAALNSTLSPATVSNKKPKLIQTTTQKDEKIRKKRKALSDESDDCSSSQYENEYNVDDMMGCVPGGDFDSDTDESAMEDGYWAPEESYSGNDSGEDTINSNLSRQNENIFGSDDSSNETSKEITAIRKFKEFPKTGLTQLSESDEGNFDSDDEFESEYYDTDSFEEEDEHFSDYDEDDYDEEDDSYDYSSESGNEYSDTDGNDFESGMPFEYYDDSDEDYQLPKHIAEDLIIHQGTCSKRDVKPDDSVSFDSDNDEVQILELKNQQTVKIIKQPNEYNKDELLKLQFEEKTLSSTTFQKKEAVPNDDEDCPELVPIVDADGFQLYNPNVDLDDDEEELENYEEESMEEYEDDSMEDVSLGGEYTELDSDDADSLLSEDINEKYLKKYNDSSDTDDNIDENIWIKKHKADVIDATGYKYESTLTKFSDHSEVSLNDDIMQIPSINLYKNVDLKTECSILSTTIIDNKIHFSNDSFDQGLSAKSIESLETEVNSCTPEAELKDEETSFDESPIVTKPHNQNVVKYNTKFFNAFNSNLVIVLLKDPFYIYGTVRLTLLAGSMEVYGHALKLNTEVEIFSPRGCSVIEIASLPTNNNISNENLKELLKLYEQQFALSDLEKIVGLYKAETDAVVLLKRNDERKKVVQQYKKFMNENVFPNISNINADRPLYNSQYLLRCMINTSSQEQKCLRLPKVWQQFKLTSSSRVMLAGGKSVGKSTLLRYLINRHLPQKVLLIDLDIGQPEVFIPQTVSCTTIEQPLLGPGFLLNLQPEIAFAVGHTNIALCAHEYLSAVRSLIAYCREQPAFKDIPWLINTMGYNRGFGLELISVLVQEPLTDVIQLQSSKEINNFESTLHAHILSNVPHILFSEEYERVKEEIKGNWNYRLHVWPSAVQQESRYQKEWEMSAKDFRFAILQARLSEALQGHADWLTDVKPLSASLNDLKIVNLMDNTPLVSTEELEKSLEANLVYLCHYEEDFKPLKCLGIGIVRAVDFHVQHLYLIPALPYTQLKDVNCLAIGEMPLPTSFFTNQGPRVKDIAPFVYNTVAASASKAIKQIYHRPAKFLKGKHKSLA